MSLSGLKFWVWRFLVGEEEGKKMKAGSEGGE